MLVKTNNKGQGIYHGHIAGLPAKTLKFADIKTESGRTINRVVRRDKAGLYVLSGGMKAYLFKKVIARHTDGLTVIQVKRVARVWVKK